MSLRPRTFSSFILVHFRPISLNRFGRSCAAQAVPSETVLVRRMSTAISRLTGRAWAPLPSRLPQPVLVRATQERACSSAICHLGCIKCCFLLTSGDTLLFSTIAVRFSWAILIVRAGSSCSEWGYAHYVLASITIFVVAG